MKITELAQIEMHDWDEGEQGYNPAVSEQMFPLWADGKGKQPNLLFCFHAGALPKAKGKRHG